MSANHNSGRDHTVNIIPKCIFKVPSVLRRQNPEAYTPDVVSIGPFHYQEKRGKDEGKGGKKGKEGEKDFRVIEEAKRRYLNGILVGMNMTLEVLTATVQEREVGFEERARNFYAESLDHITSEEFMEMMIVDGCFLVQLFRKQNNSNLRTSDDSVFNRECMFDELCHDILLLENQLPWFVINSLYSLTLEIYPGESSLSILILRALSIPLQLKQACLSHNKRHDADVLHILDLVRSSIIIPLYERAHKAAGRQAKHCQMHLLRKDSRVNKAAKEAFYDPKQHQMPTATVLSNVGIKILHSPIRQSILDIRLHVRRNIRKSIKDIRFKVRWNFRNQVVLKIPQLNIDNLFECLFRNLISIEQCYHGYNSHEITSYVIFMDNLISSKEDLELLCKEKVIISNWLSNEDGRKFFKSLYKDIPRKKSINFYYAGQCRELNDRYNTLKEHQPGENTRQQLIWFSNPWNVLYVIVGIFLLQIVPTILQTTYTIKQYYSPSP